MNPQFTNPQEEIAFLRQELAKREHDAIEQSKNPESEVKVPTKEQIAHDIVEAYKQVKPETVLHESQQMSHTEKGAIALQLAPEAHDAQIEGLYALMLQRGISNVLSVLEQMGNPHLDDDFHRFLVQYILATGAVPGAPKGSELHTELDFTLFEVKIKKATADNSSPAKGFKEMIATMEQFLYGLQSIAGSSDIKNRWFSLELSVPENSSKASFYVAVPNAAKDLFQKQLFGLYPDASLELITDDPNIFSEGGAQVASVGKATTSELLAIKTGDQYEADPIDVVIQVFSKLAQTGEGASFQVLVHPNDGGYTKKTTTAYEKLQKGEKFKDIKMADDGWHMLKKSVKDIFKDSAKDETRSDYKFEDEQAKEHIMRKLKSPIVETCLRLVVSAQDIYRANAIMSEIQSAFNQFSAPYGGGIEFSPVPANRITPFCHDYIYRVMHADQITHLNLSEISSLFHFPLQIESAEHLTQSESATSAIPIGAPKDGVLLGYNKHRGQTTNAYMAPEDRMRHLYVIGQTGTGKTGLLMNLITQDIKNGAGACFIDPHGSDIQTILSMLPQERVDDVVYFDPSYLPRPIGLNMLEFDQRQPQQKSLIIDQLMMIFNQLFDMKMSGGPLFEQYFKNSAFLVMEHPESGCTLLEITRVLAEKQFRDMKLSHCKNPIVRQFWASAEQTKGEQALENFVPYISSKFDPLISNEFLRPIIAQETSAFNMRDLMDQKKILLVNLSKGLLGELNANLLGMILVSKIQMAALSRADSYGQKLQDFYLYIDEFQNVTTPAIASILSEARKYRLSLNIAHQYMSQLTEEIKGAVLGNVGSMAVFRISPDDADKLESYFSPTFTSSDIIKLENQNAYIKMLSSGTPINPFNIKTAPYADRNPDIIDGIKQLSYSKYGRERDVVEKEIMDKYALLSKKKEPEPMPDFSI